MMQVNKSYAKQEPVPLTVAQVPILLLNASHLHHYTIPRFFSVPATINPALLRQAARYVQMQHEALRLRFILEASTWKQFLTHNYEEVPFTQIDLSTCPIADQRTAIEAATIELQGSLNLAEGPVWRLVHFNLGPSSAGRLLVIAHHLVADGFSLSIIVEDLLMAYGQLSGRKPIRLPPVITTFSKLAQIQMDYAQSEHVKQTNTYWLSRPWAKLARLPLDYPEGSNRNTVGSQRLLCFTLNKEETQTLYQISCKVYKAQSIEILLNALVISLLSWTGGLALQIAVALNGRNTYAIFGRVGLDLSRTVGDISFDTEHLVLEPGQYRDLEDVLYTIQKQFHAMPYQGISSLWLRYLCQDEGIAHTIRSLPNHQIRFNYLGQRDSLPSALLQSAEEEPGPTQHLAHSRRELITCQASITNDQLYTCWEYSENIHRHETIETLARKYMETLQVIIRRSKER